MLEWRNFRKNVNGTITVLFNYAKYRNSKNKGHPKITAFLQYTVTAVPKNEPPQNDNNHKIKDATTSKPKLSLAGNFMSFDRNSKDNITVAMSHIVFQAYLKDNFLPKSKNILLLCNF